MKEDLLRRVKEKGASAEAYEPFRAAETREELALAIVDSFAWCYRRGAVDATYLTEKFGDLLEPFGVFTGEGRAATAATAIGSARVNAGGFARVWAIGSARVFAAESAEVFAYGSAKVTAYDRAKVRARDEATVKLFDRATVEAYGDAYVENHTDREL